LKNPQKYAILFSAYQLNATNMASKGMSKSQLLSYLSEKSGHAKKDVLAFLDLLVQTAYSEAKKNGEFTLPGLGKLVKKNRAARKGRNPATGAEINIPAKTVVKFRVAKAAKDSIL
jgi:DNA-binding protein HU-beta